VSLDCCFFAVQVNGPDARAEVERRVAALERFYAPLAPQAALRFADEAGTLVGAFRFEGPAPDLDRPAVFGEPLPAALDSSESLAAAPDDELRSVEGALAALATGPRGEAVLVTAASAPTALYTAGDRDLTAWSSHAVAAGWLGLGRVEVDPSVLPEFLAAEFVGGDRTLIRGVRAVEPAMRVELGPGGVSARCFWQDAERWELLQPSEAQERGERVLLETLGRRLERVERPFCGLTAGLDSRVAAVAMRELGIDFEAYTWGEPDWPDVQGGSEVAEAVGARHHFQPFEWWEDGEALRMVHDEVRWNEGAIQVGFGRPTWPAGMSAFVTGAGGETGRCFYYRDSVRSPAATPDARRLRRVLLTSLGGRIAAARPEALASFTERVDEWIAAAENTGHRGWRCLDVVYADQRVRRWLRAMLQRSSAPMVPAFAPPELQRALISLPVTDRASDAFHRRFLGRCAPALEPAPAPPPRRGGLPPFVRRLRARLPGIRRGRPATPSVLAERWQERPGFRAWVADEVLASPLIVEPLGRRWATRTRERFLAGDAHAEEMALWAGGPVALAAALRDLA
jgi:hypothetical protein